MTVSDPYEVLGVPRDAGADEIKSAYRRLARRFHPDVNAGDASAEEKFKEIGQAYSILSDPEKRQRFDQFGTTDDAPVDPFFGGGGFADLFEMFLGGNVSGGRRSSARHGDDLRADITISLKEVITGAHRDLTLQRMATCSSCQGSGVEGGGAPEPCDNCRGTGSVSQVRNTFIGTVRTSSPCPKCGGTGALIKNPCHQCHGRGLETQSARVAVNIPAGVDDGATMQVPGQGCDGLGGGRTGDLYVVIQIEEDQRFVRDRTTLYTSVDLTYAQAALGDAITLEAVDGEYDLDIPAGTQPGDRLAIKGAGLPPLHGGRRGDLIVQTTIAVPKKLSDEQVVAIKGLAAALGEDEPKGTAKGSLLGGLFGKKK